MFSLNSKQFGSPKSVAQGDSEERSGGERKIKALQWNFIIVCYILWF